MSAELSDYSNIIIGGQTSDIVIGITKGISTLGDVSDIFGSTVRMDLADTQILPTLHQARNTNKVCQWRQTNLKGH